MENTDPESSAPAAGRRQAGTRTDEDPSNPWRRCAITRNRRPRELLIRFVADPAGRLTEDLAGRLPGRGIYVTSDRKRVTALMARHKMVPAEIDALLERLEGALLKRLQEGVGLSRRAGGSKVGLHEVEELLKRGRKPLLLVASDAGGMREKLDRLIREHDQVELLDLLDREQLSRIWGGRSVLLAAVTHPGMGQRIRIDALRWRTFASKEETVEEKPPARTNRKGGRSGGVVNKGSDGPGAGARPDDARARRRTGGDGSVERFEKQ